MAKGPMTKGTIMEMLGMAEAGTGWMARLPNAPWRNEPAAARSEAELAALVHIRLADNLWHRSGGGPIALAHRLAASVLLSLVFDDRRRWRLSALVRDIVALGEDALPGSVADLAASVEPLAGRPFVELLDLVAGGGDVAAARFQAVAALAASIAREIAALP